MDLIDILMARALTPQVQIETAAAMAREAVADATEAVDKAEAAVEAAEGITNIILIQPNEPENSNITKLWIDSDSAATIQVPEMSDIHGLTLNVATTSNSEVIQKEVRLNYVDEHAPSITQGLVKYYTNSGNNTDGTMTQKAITELATQSGRITDVQIEGTSIVNNSGVANISSATSTQIKNGIDTTKVINPSNQHASTFYGLAKAAGDATQSASNNPVGTYTSEAKIAIRNMLGISGGGGSTNLGPENAGRVVVVGSDGDIIASGIAEEEIISALIKTDTYTAKDAVGIQADYENRSYSRAQEATEYEQGSDFNKYSMYGGRMRCNVNDNGEIIAWYGDQNYKEDGSNGQVMVYQPKFYYSRTFNKTAYNGLGDVIQKETLIISPTEQTGFKLHPLFRAADGSVLDYVLLSAYEGCAYTDSYDLNDSGNIDFSTAKLSSIAGAKPISGVNKQFTLANAEQMAQNRGSGWHVTNLAMESAQQMLQMVEYGSPNSQASLETGICYIPNNGNRNCASITGSTASLGNTTGAAAATTNEINGVYTEYSDPGKRAVSYRGFENPWGNIWRMIAGINVVGSAHQNGGIPRICTDYNYSIAADATNYESIGFQLPNTYDWVSGFGVPTSKYDWVYMPIECSGGNSAVPVGDNLWTTSNLNGVNMLCCGGLWYFELSDGMFYYCCDQYANTYARSYNARLMYIPEKNTIYNNNIAAWQNKWEAVTNG
jgi:hypothetical protein